MEFYKLEIGRERKFLECGSANDWESITCKKSPEHQRAGRRTTDLLLDIISNGVVDFSRTMLGDIVITDYALNALREARLTGFEVRPSQIVGFPPKMKKENLPKLWELIVTGRGGLAHKESGIVQLLMCESCGLVRYSAFEHGIRVDENSYDGSDFFTVTEYPKYALISSRGRNAIRQARLTNVEFVESTQLEWPQGVAKPSRVV